VEAMREAATGGQLRRDRPKGLTASALRRRRSRGIVVAGDAVRADDVGDVPLRYVELRMADGKPVGIVESAGRMARFDAVSGRLSAPDRLRDQPRPRSRSFTSRRATCSKCFIA